jgi:nitrogen regulatory protein PII-like uncharacterized protein
MKDQEFSSYNNLERRQILADNVEMLLQKVTSYKEDSKNSSEDLFADFNDEKPKSHDFNFSINKNLSDFEALLKEKEFLGLYVTDNPVARYTPFLKFLRDKTGKSNLNLILINKIKKIYTKSKDMMFALEISIDGEQCEGVIFSKNAMRLSQIIEEKHLYWVKGKISVRDKKTKIDDPLNLPTPPAPSDLEGDRIPEVELEQEVREFVELPKLIIDECIAFEKGITSLYGQEREGEQNQNSKYKKVPDDLSYNILEYLSQLDFPTIKEDPYNYLKYTEPTESTESIEVGNNIPKKVILIPCTVDKETAVKIKNLLSVKIEKKEYEIEVYMETKDGGKKLAKQNYFVSKQDWNNYLSEFESK